MLELDLTAADNNGYKNFKIGANKCWITGVSSKTSQSGNKMLVIKLRDKEGATLKDHLVLTESAMWRVKQFLKACQLPHNGKVSIDEKDITGRHIIVNCYAEAYKKQDGSDGTLIRVKEFIVDNDYSFAPKEEPKTEPKEESAVPF
jgi:hypothetical protein